MKASETILRLNENRVWRTYTGGRSMAAWRGKTGEDDHRPEDWLGSVTRAINANHPDDANEGLSRVYGIDGELLLKDLIEADPEGMLGKQHVAVWGSTTALLVKALDAAERLAIQAHPDRKDAKKYFQSAFGKTEAWYVVSAREDVHPAPAVLFGFKENVTPALWRELFEKQDIPGMQSALHRLHVHTGDVLLIEGGLPHAIGEGCFLIEIQEPTDYTLRVERSTPGGMVLSDAACHQGAGFDAMLSMFHYDALTEAEVLARYRKMPVLLAETDDGLLESLLSEADTPCFRLLRQTVHGSMPLSMNDGVFELAVAVEGNGSITYAGGTLAVHQGDSFFLPAGVEEASVSGEGLTLLLCRPPRTRPE